MNNSPTLKSPRRPGDGVGPAISVVLVVVLMIMGGLYFLYTRLQGGL